MAVLATTDIALKIVCTVLDARGVQQDVRSEIDPRLEKLFNMLMILLDFVFGLNK